MRAGVGADRMFELWADPSFQPLGDLRPRGIVTCEPGWYLTAEAGEDVGALPKSKRPIRWYQRADNSQTEIEIPNVRGYSKEESIDSDAATCIVTLTNQWMQTNFAVAIAQELGMPGYFTFNRGESTIALARWNHEANEWAGRLVPGALLRTYSGYGGHDKTREEALEDGDIMLTGVWIVDDVTIGARSKLIELKCRNMAALLIDQPIYSPPIPPGLYPIRYQRWVDTTTKIGYKPKHPKPAVHTNGGPVSARYETSSVDAWYGANYTLHGHRGSQSIDGNPNTYALGEGNSGPDKPFATSYWQYNTGRQDISAIQVQAWKGGYQMYVSVMENGRWLGSDTVPYDPSSLVGNQPTVVDTGADIKYVLKVGVPPDRLFTVNLPRTIRADRVRISFRHLVHSGIGNPPTSWPYRAGVREFKALAVKSSTAASTRPYGWSSIESHPTADGYWTLSYEGKVHAFGQAVHYGDHYGKSNQVWADIVATPTGLGYWLLPTNGRVIPYGDANDFVLHGQADIGYHAIAMARTYTGFGYWIVYRNGDVRSFGDAPEYPDFDTDISDVIGHPSVYGGWVLYGSGSVEPFGDAVFEGSVSIGQTMHGIDAMPDGVGFLLLGPHGHVCPRGSASGDDVVSGATGTHLSTPDAFDPGNLRTADRLAINHDATGYWVIDTYGQVYARGSANRWGSPADGAATTRRDGNYLDYADIVADLVLWAGFWLREDVPFGTMPSVYGNIETTGIFSPEPLSPSMFDKRPFIDPIKQLREIVGYLTWVDDEGGFHFESPNWWAAGNFLSTGHYTDYIPEIDEAVQLTDYTVRTSKQKERSEIIVTTDEPTAGFDDTITSRYQPANSYLRGMSIPAMVRTPLHVTKEEQEVMAELIALHLWFARRTGQVSMLANPAIQINDQVRIFERVTAETFIHYVRAISLNHDFQSGSFTQQLTTNWLGTEEGSWTITAADILPPVGTPETGSDDNKFPISPALSAFLQQITKNPLKTGMPVAPAIDVDNPPAAEGSASP